MVKRPWMRMTALLCAAAFPGLLAGCHPARPTEARAVVPELKLEAVRFRVYRGDALRVTGDARTLAYRRDTRDVAATDLVATVLEPGRDPAEIAAPEGTGNLEARTFAIRGGVRAARGGDAARTEAAAYDGASGTVRGDAPIVVEGPGYRLDGTGFTLRPATGELVVHGSARLVAGAAEAR